MANDGTGVDMAIAVLSAWLEMGERFEDGSSPVPDSAFMVNVMRGYMEESTETRTLALAGLVSLAGQLLVALADETGVAPRAILQEYARRDAG